MAGAGRGVGMWTSVAIWATRCAARERHGSAMRLASSSRRTRQRRKAEPGRGGFERQSRKVMSAWVWDEWDRQRVWMQRLGGRVCEVVQRAMDWKRSK